jgi:hypothetical protein
LMFKGKNERKGACVLFFSVSTEICFKEKKTKNTVNSKKIKGKNGRDNIRLFKHQKGETI